MKRQLAFALATLLAAAVPFTAALAQDAGEDQVYQVDADDPVMDAAIAEAQRTLPDFLALLAEPPAGTSEFMIKYPLAGWEHIWVDNLTIEGEAIAGALANTPVEEGYQFGQRVSVPLAEISDWAYRAANGVMQGHRTTRVLLGQAPDEMAAAILADFGWD
ncbi:MAG TPA: DUF2314 domain-containing protein [Croceibacterium sp.]|nr:DUF2314 domain-containing protein [Propylenella sp.]HYD24353.1 DUF2314 domain-containing protein [Croceibacterium sp.]